MNFTRKREFVAVLAFVALVAFGAGAAVQDFTTEPEVVTVSEDVPPACADAARAGAAGFKAWENLGEYETRAQTLAADLTLSLLSGDASKIEKELTPIAEHNAKEAEWRGKRDDAWAVFETAADECLAKAAAAEAARGR